MKLKIFHYVRNSAWRLIVFHQTMYSFAVGLVLCALIGGIYGERLYFVFALSAASAVYLAFAWWNYQRAGKLFDEMHVVKVPDILRRERERKRHLPAFLRGNDDWQDDLVAFTLPNEELLENDERQAARVVAYVFASILLAIMSFVL